MRASNLSAVTFSRPRSGICFALFPAIIPENSTKKTAEKAFVIYRPLSRMKREER